MAFLTCKAEDADAVKRAYDAGFKDGKSEGRHEGWETAQRVYSSLERAYEDQLFEREVAARKHAHAKGRREALSELDNVLDIARCDPPILTKNELRKLLPQELQDRLQAD